MERHGEEVDLTTTEARSGSTPNIVRWVLIISLVLVVVGMSVIWITGALSTDDAQDIAPVTNQAVPGERLPPADEQVGAEEVLLPPAEPDDNDVEFVKPE